MTNFTNFGLPASLIQSLDKMAISKPTPVQAATIPPAMDGQDILASAETGTGKTLAYLLPIIHHLLNSQHDSALIMLPTRELAAQVKEAAHKILGRHRELRTALLIGGDPIFKQFTALKQNPRLIIGTPGRIDDHLKRGTLKLKQTQFLVLDETDRMLDMGFCDAIDLIIQHLPKQRQTYMFSATMPDEIVKLSKKYLTNPAHITIGKVSQASKQIKQEVMQTTVADKFAKLLRELSTRQGSVIIFVNTKINAEKLADRLNENDHPANEFHGDLKQRQREKVLRNFLNGKNGRIIVATDIASRGLDIPHVKHVINYNLPQCPEDYIHRIGRTGRAGMTGSALSLVSPDDHRKWNDIHRLVTADGKIDLPRFTVERNAKKSFNQKRSAKNGFAKRTAANSGSKSHPRSEKSFRRYSEGKARKA